MECISIDPVRRIMGSMCFASSVYNIKSEASPYLPFRLFPAKIRKAIFLNHDFIYRSYRGSTRFRCRSIRRMWWSSRSSGILRKFDGSRLHLQWGVSCVPAATAIGGCGGVQDPDGYCTSMFSPGYTCSGISCVPVSTPPHIVGGCG